MCGVLGTSSQGVDCGWRSRDQQPGGWIVCDVLPAARRSAYTGTQGARVRHIDEGWYGNYGGMATKGSTALLGGCALETVGYSYYYIHLGCPAAHYCTEKGTAYCPCVVTEGRGN